MEGAGVVAEKADIINAPKSGCFFSYIRASIYSYQWRKTQISKNFKHIITVKEQESSWKNTVLSSQVKPRVKGRMSGEIRPDSAAQGL